MNLPDIRDINGQVWEVMRDINGQVWEEMRDINGQVWEVMRDINGQVWIFWMFSAASQIAEAELFFGAL